MLEPLGVELIRQGKVREVYADEDDVILVASDQPVYPDTPSQLLPKLIEQ